MKKWESPVLSVLRRSTSAEKVLVICKHINNPIPQPAINFCGNCVTLLPSCATCQAVNLS
jgi:hypothetical protein